MHATLSVCLLVLKGQALKKDDPKKEPEDPLHAAVDGLSKAFDKFRKATVDNIDSALASTSRNEALQKNAVDLTAALFQAVKRNNADKILELHAQGANINAANRNGDTPLHVAAREDHTDVIEALLQCGAHPRPSKPDNAAHTPLADAVRFGNLSAAKLLAERGGFDERLDGEGLTLFLQAIKRDKADIARALARAGANVCARSPAGESALYIAISSRNRNSALFLLDLPEMAREINAPLQLENEASRSFLQMCAVRKDETVIKKLLALGANPNIRDSEGWTALGRVTEDADDEVAALLLAGGADANAPCNANGETPLFLAATSAVVGMYARQSILETLIEGGADPDARDRKTGMTALCAAIGKGRASDVIETLLDAGANPHVIDHKGLNALHHAVQSHHLDALAQLLLRGARLEEKCKVDGSTPLMFAVKRGFLDMAQMLLEAGANPHTQDTMEQSALAHARARGDKRMIKLLEDAIATSPVPARKPAGGPAP